MKTANELLHELIREQNKALYYLMERIKQDIPRDTMSAHLKVFLDNAEALCQKPPGDKK